MDTSRLFQMIINMFFRKIVNKGINAGINMAATGGKSKDQMTPEEREQARKMRDLGKNARKLTSFARRIGR